MFVNNSKKFVFIHVPKTGGISITKELSLDFKNDDCHWELYNDNQHLTAAALRERYPDYFFFAFVRNPWDRMVSFYHFKKKQAIRKVRKAGMTQRVIFPEFKKFVHSLCVTGRMANLMTNSQKSFLCSESGEIICDSVRRFERLRSEYRHVLARYSNLPLDLRIHKNKSEYRGDYRSYYDPEMIEWVREFWKEDVEEFDYEFGS